MSEGMTWQLRAMRWQDDPDLPDLVDHIFTDPPFDEDTHANARVRGGLADRQGRDDGGAALAFAALDIGVDVSPLLERVRRWSVFKCAIEQVGDYKRLSPETYVRGGIWPKTNAMPQLTGDRPAAFGECFAIFHAPGRKRWNRGGHAASWPGPTIAQPGPFDEKIHDTQTPLWLATRLVEDFTDPGETVWDPFAGSATIGVACILTGRRYLGHECDLDMAAKARRRLEAAAEGQPLSHFDAGQVVMFGG